MRRVDRAASLVVGVLALFLARPCAAQGGAGADRGAKVFVEKCSPCHTVGGGDQAGPDLVVASRRTPDAVRAAVHRMEDNVGSLPVDDVEALVSLLKSPESKRLIAAAENPPAAPKVEVARGSAANGKRLFYGEAHFANGGTPCFACHTFAGRGGNLAADLTLVQTRLNEAVLVSTARQPAFPLMKAAYAAHAVTEPESLDLAAFLGQSQTAAPRERTGIVHGAAAGAAAIVLAGVGLILRTRRSGVRSRLVRGARRGE